MDGRTDGQNYDSQDRASISSRGKNLQLDWKKNTKTLKSLHGESNADEMWCNV